MSLECGFCERDLRGRHDADCPRKGGRHVPADVMREPRFGKIEEAESALTTVQGCYLTARGWLYTSNTPGCIWLYQKKLPDGRTALCDLKAALWIQSNLDWDPKWKPTVYKQRRKR